MLSYWPFKRRQQISLDTVNQCSFCDISPEGGFTVVAEDEALIVIRDRKPAALHHFLVIPKKHIGTFNLPNIIRRAHIHVETVKCLTQTDIPLVQAMHDLGNQVLDDMGVPIHQRQLGFHIPPVNSVDHLHLHVLGLPFHSFRRRVKYPVMTGTWLPYWKIKGWTWFITSSQTTRALEWGRKISVWPCWPKCGDVISSTSFAHLFPGQSVFIHCTRLC